MRWITILRKNILLYLNIVYLYFIFSIINTSIRLNRSEKHSFIPNPLSIIEIDEDEDIENRKMKSPSITELVRNSTSLSLPTTKKEVNFL